MSEWPTGVNIAALIYFFRLNYMKTGGRNFPLPAPFSPASRPTSLPLPALSSPTSRPLFSRLPYTSRPLYSRGFPPPVPPRVKTKICSLLIWKFWNRFFFTPYKASVIFLAIMKNSKSKRKHKGMYVYLAILIAKTRAGWSSSEWMY